MRRNDLCPRMQYVGMSALIPFGRMGQYAGMSAIKTFAWSTGRNALINTLRNQMVNGVRNLHPWDPIFKILMLRGPLFINETL